MAEQRADLSPYRFAYNNPISFTDPNGMSEDVGGDWDEENDNNIDSDKGDRFLHFEWTENARNNEQGVNVFERSILIALDIINLDFRISSDIKSGGDSSFADDFRGGEDSNSIENTGNGNLSEMYGGPGDPPSNKEITPFQLGVEWLTGTGPRHRNFTNGDTMTEMLKQHSFVEDTRDIILSKAKSGVKFLSGTNPYKLGGVKGVGLYIKDYSTLLTGGLTGNLAVTYLGSYDLKWTAAVYNKTVVVSFNVENSSTMQSASRPPIVGYLPMWQNTVGKSINEKFKTGWGSKTTQSFNWTEVLYLK